MLRTCFEGRIHYQSFSPVLLAFPLPWPGYLGNLRRSSGRPTSGRPASAEQGAEMSAPDAFTKEQRRLERRQEADQGW